jgi:hypothetical protein
MAIFTKMKRYLSLSKLKGGATVMIEVLNRETRGAILERCLTNWALIKRCYKYEKLLDQPISDLLDEVGVKIYQSLFYYRFTRRLKGTLPPEEQAFKIAMEVGLNHLGDLVRAASRQRHTTVSIHAGPWANTPSSAVYDHSMLQITTVLTMVAGHVVGAEQASFLVRATVYDWQNHTQLTPAQLEIMKGLGKRNRLQMRRLLDKYREEVRAELEPMPQLYQRVEGVWRAAPHNAA